MTVDMGFGMSPDKGRIALYMKDVEHGIVVETILTTEELEIYIRNLGNVRAQMLPPHPRALDPNPHFKSITRDTPFCLTRPSAVSREVMLSILHPGFGWLSFPLHPDVASRLAVQVAKMVTEQPSKGPIIGLDGKPLR